MSFSIKASFRENDLHLDLQGVFDGSSAHELVNCIERQMDSDMKQEKNPVRHIFIDTNAVTRTLPFGKAVLEARLPKNRHRACLHFSGPCAGDLAPEGCSMTLEAHECTGQCRNCTCGQTPSKRS